jgi:hypothetical protein
MVVSSNITCQDSQFLVYYDVSIFPPNSQTINWILFSLYVIYVVGTFILFMYYHSTDPILQSRSRLFIFVCLCGGLMENCNSNLRDAMGRDKYPCDMYLWFVLLMLGIGLGAVVAQYYVTFSRHIYAQLLAETMHSATGRGRGATHRASTKSTSSTSKIFLLDFSFIESDEQQHSFLWFIIHLPVLLFNGRKKSSSSSATSTNNNVINQVISAADDDDTENHKTKKTREVAEAAATAADFTLWRRIALSRSTKYVLICFIVFPFFLACIILQFQGYPYNAQCTGCELSVNMQVGFIILGVVIAILAIFASYRLREFPDPLQLRISLDVGLGGTCFFCIVGLLMSLVDPNDLMARGIIVWGWFIALAYAWVYSCYCVYPLYIVFKHRILSISMNSITKTGGIQDENNQDFKPLDFYQVVEDVQLLREFEQHLRAEFAEESLFAYFAICEFEDHTKKHNGVVDVNAALSIYSTFIKLNAPLQLNLPGEITETLRKIFEQQQNTAAGSSSNNNNIIVDGNIFEEAKKELVFLMSRDGLRRFAQQKKLKGGDSRNNNNDQVAVVMGGT